jgi:hypothetical protein
MLVKGDTIIKSKNFFIYLVNSLRHKNLAVVYLFLITACSSTNSKVNDQILDTNKISYADTLLRAFNSEPCLSGIDSANKEAKKGNYTYLIGDLVYYTEFNKYFRNHLIEEYNIRLFASCYGDIPQPTLESCFFTQATNEVEAKFGKYFINQKYLECKSKFKGKLTEED